MKLKGLRLSACLIMLLVLGGMASGQCDPDGNNSSREAVLIGYTDTISDYVCPEDLFDYYYFEVASGADVTGTITFDAPQTGTVIRVAGDVSGTVFEDSTTDAERSLTFTIETGDLSAETYYMRVSHWSSYAYDHAYTITMDLTATGPSDCVPDGNNDAENAVDIGFGESASDWVCGDDHVDVYHFTVSTEREGRGKISLACDPGELKLFLYDSSETEIYSENTSGGTLQYDLGTSESPLANGEYYIGVFLPLARSDENSYTLGLARGGLILENLPVVSVFKAIEFEEEEEEEGITLGEGALPLLYAKPFVATMQTPWRSIRGGPMNTGHSHVNGPQEPTRRSRRKIFEADINDLRSGEEEYKWLLIGPDNKAVFMRTSDTNFVVYDLDTEEIENYRFFSSPSPKPPAFDGEGHFYCTNYSGYLECYEKFDPSQELVPRKWSVHLRGDEDKMSVEAVGRKVIASCYDGGWYIYVFNKDASAAWNYGPLDDSIVGVAEDSQGPVWVQTMKSIYRFNDDGMLDWNREMPMDGRRLTHDVYLPIIRKNRCANVFHQLTDYSYNYHPEGYYTNTSWYYDLLPKVYCAGQDGRKYSVNGGNSFYCYDTNWTTIEWCKDIPGETKDMVQGFDNKSYVVYIRTNDVGTKVLEFQMFDPDGNVIETQMIGTVPQEIHALDLPIELAIGEGNKLVILHHSGYLYVYS